MASPTVLARASNASSTSDSTSFTVTMPTVTAGKSLLAVVSSDGVPNVSSWTDGWFFLKSQSNTTVVRGFVFWKPIATGSDTLSLTFSSAEQYSAVTSCIDAGPFPNIQSADVDGSGANSNPVAITLTSAEDILVVVARCGDSTIVPTVAPSSYTNLTNRAAGGTGGASTSTAERSLTATSTTDPGTFTVATEQWAAFTIAIWSEDTACLMEGGADLDDATFGSDRLSYAADSLAYDRAATCVIGYNSGQHVFAATCVSLATGDDMAIGVATVRYDFSTGLDNSTEAFRWGSDGEITYNNSAVAFVDPWGEGDKLYLAYDADTGDARFKVNAGAWSAVLEGVSDGNYWFPTLALWNIDGEWLLDPSAIGHGLSGYTGWDGGGGTTNGAGSASGSGVGSGVGGPIKAAVATAAGIGAALAVGAAIVAGAGSAAGAGAGAASGVGSTGGSVASGAGSASGTSAVLAIGVAIVTGAGLSTGTGAAGGSGATTSFTDAGVGTANSAGAALAAGRSTAAGDGLASGAGAVAAVGQTLAAGGGVAVGAGQGAASGSGASVAAVAGLAQGQGGATAPGVGRVMVAVTGSTSGAGSALAVWIAHGWVLSAESPAVWARDTLHGSVWIAEPPASSPWTIQ